MLYFKFILLAIFGQILPFLTKYYLAVLANATTLYVKYMAKIIKNLLKTKIKTNLKYNSAITTKYF